MVDLELCYMPALEMAKRIREKTLSPVEVVNNSLERINDIGPILNCFCFTYPEEALERARSIESRIMRGESCGPLAGVPIALKDFTPTKGKTTTRGSLLLKDWVPDYDSVLTERLLEAGAILIGKTTTPEFAASAFTRSLLWGETKNPWNPKCSPGASSGGSAAAVASGCVPMAEGTDMGGSVRIPAAHCGIVGHKPSLGRLPMDIIDTVYDSISHFGPLARTIDDAALFVDVTQGIAPIDIQTIPRCNIPIPTPTNVVDLKIALDVDLGFYAVHPGVKSNLWRVVEALCEAGATVEEVDLGWDKRLQDIWYQGWLVYLAAAFKAQFGDCFEEKRDQLDPYLASRIEKGFKLDAVTVRMWEFERSQYWRSLAGVLENYNALLCPTMVIPAPSNEKTEHDFSYVDENSKLHGDDMTAVFNLFSQCPALSVPSGFVDGMPTAAQIITGKWDDPLAFRIGAAIEAALPWANNRPPL